MAKKLTPDQIQAYHHDGVLFPLPALTKEEVEYFRSLYDEFDRYLGRIAKSTEKAQCHLHLKWACDLATHPRVLDAVEDIIGPDILIHSSTFFAKHAKDEMFISWHQDSPYWGLSEPRLVSAWIALTESNIGNGCLRVLPGTQTRIFEHLEQRAENNMLGTGLTVSESLDLGTAVDIVLRAGEMSFHHANIIHGSKPNTSTSPRIGFAVRYVSTAVKQERGHHEVILARGEDKYHYYNIQDKPTAGLKQGMIAKRIFDSDPSKKF
ncbi:MAG TPA: phytanoyl-CoA dioxygenase family protein [Blastocatellia bacterium]|nr:phytanoyl-CoA dioxygenase family protein [Blastocatellia bacterium]